MGHADLNTDSTRRLGIGRASVTDDDAKARRYGPTGHMLPACGVTATASPNLAPPERRGFFFCAAGFDAIDGMLLDMLAPIARKDYEDRPLMCQAFGCAAFPSDGAKSPAHSRLLTGGGFFLASESLVDVFRSYNTAGSISRVCGSMTMRKLRKSSPTPSLSIRIDLDTEGRIGPGKIQLLENIHSCGSISAAGRAMHMSYKRAWDLVEEINRFCKRTVVERWTGGKDGGGAALTPFGVSLIARYRKIENSVGRAVHKELRALRGDLRSMASR